MKKKYITIYFSLALVTFLAAILIIEPGFVFGSKTDWINQHTTFPEYFRQLFYTNKNLLPNFAPHIGAGQNIFNFSYYGLLNPIILISYLFPKLEMTTYIIIANIFLFVISTLLLFYFLNKHTKNSYHAVVSTLISVFAASFLFHFHRHFMFVNYMPFLILGLLAIDQYFEKGKKTLLTLSTFLMIMTSYYYSMIGIFVFILYGINRYLKHKERITVKEFLKDGFQFMLPILLAILMAAILLLPTAYVILIGRGSKEKIFSLKELFFPQSNLNAILYDTYSLGLTSISILALLNLILKKEKENQFLGLSILITISVPFIIYILNGGLYIRNKVFIPFLPLFGIALVKFFDDLWEQKIKEKKLFLLLFFLIIAEIFSTTKISFFFFGLDILLTFLVLFLSKKTKKKLLATLPILLITLTTFFVGQKIENYTSKELLKESFNKNEEKKLNSYLQNEKYITRAANLDNTLYTVNRIISKKHYTTSVYSSTFHKEYNEFQQKVFKNPLPNRNTLILAQSNNIMFQTFMGIKYLSYKGSPSIGYKPLTTKKGKNIYKNNNVMPLGYATNQILNEKELTKLPYPKIEEALIGNIVIKEKTNFQFQSKSREIFPDYKMPKNTKNLTIKKKQDKYIIDAKKDSKFKLYLDKNVHNEIIFITFNIHNQTSCDLPNQKIGINGTYNKISCMESEYQNHNNTFHYVLSKEEDWNTLNVLIGKGHYIISDIRTYILDYSEIKNKAKTVDPWYVENIKNDILEGNITVTKDGYFATTIPYDEGFDIYVDGKKQSYEKVNTAFLGFKIKKGNHHIKMVYHSPYLKEGIILSLLGLCGFLLEIILDYKN